MLHVWRSPFEERFEFVQHLNNHIRTDKFYQTARRMLIRRVAVHQVWERAQYPQDHETGELTVNPAHGETVMAERVTVVATVITIEVNNGKNKKSIVVRGDHPLARAPDHLCVEVVGNVTLRGIEDVLENHAMTSERNAGV
jgi:hypothetical protein